MDKIRFATGALSRKFFKSRRFDPESIRGKRVLVTGASSGIGEAVVYRYAKLGAKLVITARRSELLKKVAVKSKEIGAEDVHVVGADMSSPDDLPKLVSETKNFLGGLDYVVLNHARLHYSWWKNTTEDSYDLQGIMNVNFLSYVDLTSRLLPMLEKSNGNISVVSSVAGKFGSIGTSQYGAAKHALHGFFSTLRQELRCRKSGVSITLLVFGPVKSAKVIEIMTGVPQVKDVMSLAATPAQAAEVLVKAAATKKYEVYYPFLSKALVFLYRLTPKFLENMASSSNLPKNIQL